MANFIEIRDFAAPELDVYARLTENQLLCRRDPENAMFIAESPMVIERALDAAKKAGEEGSLLTAWYGPVVLELYGAGATDYVLSSGGVKDGDAGFYYAPIAALRDLPEGLGMRQAQAETLALAPADAEWVLVYPNDDSEVPQP